MCAVDVVCIISRAFLLYLHPMETLFVVSSGPPGGRHNKHVLLLKRTGIQTHRRVHTYRHVLAAL